MMGWVFLDPCPHLSLSLFQSLYPCLTYEEEGGKRRKIIFKQEPLDPLPVWLVSRELI